MKEAWYIFKWYVYQRYVFKSWCNNHNLSTTYIDRMCDDMLREHPGLKTITDEMKRMVRQ